MGVDYGAPLQCAGAVELGVTKATAAVLRNVAQGKITVSVGRDLVSIIDAQRRSMELIEIYRRLTALERARGR